MATEQSANRYWMLAKDTERGATQHANLGHVQLLISCTTLESNGALVFIHKMKITMAKDEIMMINTDTASLPSALSPPPDGHSPHLLILLESASTLYLLMICIYITLKNHPPNWEWGRGVAYYCCVTDEETET